MRPAISGPSSSAAGRCIRNSSEEKRTESSSNISQCPIARRDAKMHHPGKRIKKPVYTGLARFAGRDAGDVSRRPGGIIRRPFSDSDHIHAAYWRWRYATPPAASPAYVCWGSCDRAGSAPSAQSGGCDVVQRPFHGLLAHRQRGNVMVRQQNVLWTQLKSFQLGQCAIDGILQLADVAGPAVAGKHRTEIGRELRRGIPCSSAKRATNSSVSGMMSCGQSRSGGRYSVRTLRR